MGFQVKLKYGTIIATAELEDNKPAGIVNQSVLP